MEQKNKPQPPKAKPLKEKVDAAEAKEAFEKTQNQFAPPPGTLKAKSAVKAGDIKPPAEANPPVAKDIKPEPVAPPPAPEPITPPAPTGDPNTIAQHTVVAGDNLSMISQKYYGTQNHFMKIYQANKAVIGDDPSRIRAGQVLKIPKV